MFNFLNDRVRGVLNDEMPRFKMGGDEDEATLMNEGSAKVDATGQRSSGF